MKEKRITIREGAPQMEQATVPESAPQLKKDGKRKVGESVESPPLGSVLNRVVRLQCCLFLLQRFRLKGWLFILNHSLGP